MKMRIVSFTRFDWKEFIRRLDSERNGEWFLGSFDYFWFGINSLLNILKRPGVFKIVSNVFEIVSSWILIKTITAEYIS